MNLAVDLTFQRALSYCMDLPQRGPGQKKGYQNPRSRVLFLFNPNNEMLTKVQPIKMGIWS